ncbi:MAG: hypothetical protein OEY14_08605 [Myxococcales bacterium]|nr:hypothetical protein [Myxococcales bacterium]
MGALAANLLREVAAHGRYGLVDQVLRGLWDFETDDLSRAFIHAASDAQMRRFAQAPGGRTMLLRLYDELIRGQITPEDRTAFDRIALHLGGGGATSQEQLREAEAAQSEHYIFPYALPPIYRFENGAPIHAELEGGRVLVDMPVHVLGNVDRYPEAQALPPELFSDQLSLNLNLIVGVRYYDRPIPRGEQRPPLLYHRAFELTLLAREGEVRVRDNILEVASLASIILGAVFRVPGLAISLLEWIERIADAIGVLATVLRDYSSSLRGPGGEALRSFVEGLDLVLSLISVANLMASISGLRSALGRWWQRPSPTAPAPNEVLPQLNGQIRQLDAALEEIPRLDQLDELGELEELGGLGARRRANPSAHGAPEAPRRPGAASITSSGEVHVAFPQSSPLDGHGLQYGPEGIKLCTDCSILEQRLRLLLEFDDWSDFQRAQLLGLQERNRRALGALRRPMPGAQVPAGATPPARITQATADAIAGRIESQLLPRVAEAAADGHTRERLLMNPAELDRRLQTTRQAAAGGACGRTGGELTGETPDATVQPRPDRGHPTTNSAGQAVRRTLVHSEDELLAVAELRAGGSLDSFTEYKPNWWQSPDGRTRIEFTLEGHAALNEGPHVTVRQFDGRRHSVIEKVFIEGRERLR